MRPLRTVVVGDALLPTTVIEEALGELAGLVEVVATLDWGPADEAEVDRLALVLEQGGPQIEPPPEALWGVLSDVEVLLVHYCPVSKEVVDAAPRLAAVGTCRSGTENIDLDALFERRIPVIHTVGRTTEAVSDFTIGLLLAEMRNIARAHHRMMDGRWEKGFANSPFTPELRGRTVGIVGMGEIGRAVARKLSASGCVCSATTRSSILRGCGRMGWSRPISISSCARRTSCRCMRGRCPVPLR
jgi:D-3-phosphoglycerate dehydrogenase